MTNEKLRQFGQELANLVYQGARNFMSIWRLKKSGQEIVTKKDAVGILIYHEGRRQLVFTKQYRPAVGHDIIEITAGHIESSPPNTDPVYWAKATMAREAEEEVGAKNIDPNRIQLIFENGIFTSPGFTTEQLWLGFVRITAADIEAEERIFGLAEEGEQIKRVWVDVDDLEMHLNCGAFYDMKTIALVEWFLRNKRCYLTAITKH